MEEEEEEGREKDVVRCFVRRLAMVSDVLVCDEGFMCLRQLLSHGGIVTLLPPSQPPPLCDFRAVGQDLDPQTTACRNGVTTRTAGLLCTRPITYFHACVRSLNVSRCTRLLPDAEYSAFARAVWTTTGLEHQAYPSFGRVALCQGSIQRQA